MEPSSAKLFVLYDGRARTTECSDGCAAIDTAPTEKMARRVSRYWAGQGAIWFELTVENENIINEVARPDLCVDVLVPVAA